MCLAVPAEVKKVQDEVATCQIGEGTCIDASLMLLDEAVEPGDYLLIHAGFALRRLEAEEAEETLRLMRQMAESGDGLTSW
jgi:hydrogenase expression/formation protein HypC